MSCLTVYADSAPETKVLRTEDPDQIASALSEIGVRFERWSSPVALTAESDSDTILAAYRPYLDELMGSTGAGSADVVSITPDHPQAEALRRNFLDEHTHTEDEIRFFVRGSGNFVLHVNDKIYDAYCTQNDLISVPAHIRHWFDAGERPSFTVLRVFTDTSGWVPHFTGDEISARFPASQ